MLLLILGAFLALPAHAFDMPTTDYQFGVSSDLTTMGPVGGKGDVLQELMIIPMQPTNLGTIWLHDGGGLSHKLFDGGTVVDVKPIMLPLGMRSVSGAWTVSTGANVRILGIGRFK